MKSFIAAFIVAGLVGGILTPLVRRFALWLGAVSHPGGRHVHGRVVPRLGGLAILAAFFSPLVGLLFVESAVAEAFTSQSMRVIGLFVGGAAMCAVGFVDDTRGVRALHKLYFQLGVAVLAYACGYRIDAVELPLFGAVSMGVFGLPVTVAWIVGIINAVNLIDGLDGLAAGVVFFAALTNFVVARLAGSDLVALLMASIMGAVIGFLFHNFNPARIFMGDSGSYFLGFVLAVTSLSGGPKASTAVALLVPVIALGVPIFDVLLAMVRRVLERRSIFSPDRGHLHHRLLDLGLTHRRAVLIIYGVCVVFAGSAIAVYIGRSWQVGVALLTAATVLIALIRFAGYFKYFQAYRSSRGQRAPEVERLRRALPALASSAADAVTAPDVLMSFADFCGATEICSAKLADLSSGTVVHEFVPEPDTPPGCSITFDLSQEGRRPLELRLALGTDEVEPSAQAQILLQVAADIVEANLARTRSVLFSLEESERAREDGRESRPLELPS